MKFSVKHMKFKENDYLVQTHKRLVITDADTLEEVPNFGNLREMVRLAVEEFKRKEAELKAIEEAPKEVVNPTPTVSEAPKETERKEEHAE